MDPLNELLEKARKLNEEEKYEEVTEFLSKELLAEHNNATLYIEKARAYQQLGNGAALFSMADKVNALRPDLAIELFNQVTEHYNKRIITDPEDTDALDYLGTVCQRLRQYERSIEYFEKQIGIKPASEAYYGIGYGYNELGLYDQAVRALDKAAELNPKSANTYNFLGNIYKKTNKIDEALKNYYKAIESNPDSAYPYNGLGNIYKEQKDYDKAIEHYTRAIELSPNDPYPYNGLGNTYMDLKDYDKAIENYKKSTENSSDYWAPYNGLGNVYIDLKDYDNAIVNYKRAIELSPDDAYPYNGLGNAYKDLKDYDNAVRNYKRSIEIAPGYSAPYNGAGNVYTELKDYDKAIEHYKRAIELSPDDAYPYNGLGNVYKDLKDYDKAIDSYERSIEIMPSYSSPHNGLGNVYNDLKEHNKAIEYYKKALELDPNDPLPYNGLGNAYSDLEEYDKAIESYKRSIEINPGYSLPYNGLGNVQNDLKDYDLALETYQKAIDADPNDAYPYNGLGNVYSDLKEDDKAIESYTRAIACDPSYNTAYYNRALTYKGMEKYREALSDYVRYVELTKDAPDYYTSLAQSAISELEKLIENPILGNVSSLVDSIKKLLLFSGETVTHYTSLTVANILIISSDSVFLLSEGAYLNDTSEGRELFSYLSFQSNTKINNETIAQLFAKKPFIGSFVSEKKHDDLTLWRMYGKENKEEAKGCAITLNRDMFLSSLKKKLAPAGDERDATAKNNEEFNFYRVAYRKNDGNEFFILPGAEQDEKELNEYMSRLAGFIKKFNAEERSETERQDVHELLNGIAYLFKSAEYQYEHELRLVVKGTGIEKIISADQPPRVRIALVGINPILKKITLGPKVERADEWAAAFFYKLDKEGYNPEILISHLPFK